MADGEGVDLEVGDLVKVTVLIERSEDTLWLPPAAIRTFEGAEPNIKVTWLHTPDNYGEKLLAILAAGNRDPDHFEDPERFDVTRYAEGRDTAPHLSFGGGAHLCLGAHLARREITLMFREILRRLPDIEVVGEPDYLLQVITRTAAAILAARTPPEPAPMTKRSKSN